MSIAVTTTSTAQGFVTDSSTLDINQPAGVLVDDVLLMVVGQNVVTPGTLAISGGWTLAEGISNGDSDASVYYRVADAGDVSATNYTFSIPSGFITIDAACLRLSGADTDSTVEASDSGTGSGTNPSTSISADPLVEELVQIFICSAEDANDDLTGLSTTPARTLTSLVSNRRAQIGYAVVSDSSGITGLAATSNGTVTASFAAALIRQAYPSTGTVAYNDNTPVFFSVAGSAGGNGSTSALFPTTNLPTQSGVVDNESDWTNTTRPSLAQAELNAVWMDGNNAVYMDGDNEIYREEGTGDWINQTRP